jgi:phospholipase/carboxylesterase
MTALEARTRAAAGEPEGALVLLHGRGADEHDLYPLLDVLDPERRLHGVTPRAPLQLPPGGFHWYRLGGIPTPDPETFDDSVPLLAALLDDLPVGLDRVVLGGFSQGGVMSWAMSLGPARPRPAAVIALSCFLPRVEGWPLTLTGLNGFPAFVAHGSLDPVIAAGFGHEARDALTAAGADVRWHESPVPHTIDPQLLPELRDFVSEVLPSG